jgi:hypothetical protein
VDAHTQCLLNSNAELRARVDRLESPSKMPAEQHAQMAAVHEQAAQLGQLHDIHIPPPMPGEDVQSFTARAFTPFKQFSRWKDVELSRAGESLPVIVADISHDAERAIDTQPGLRMIERVDPYSKARRIEFHGDDDGATWLAFTNPLRIGNFAAVKAAAKAWYME